MSNNEPKTRAEMIGEALREMGVLAAVFIPIDYMFTESPKMTIGWVIATTVVWGAGLWVIGMFIEEKRR